MSKNNVIEKLEARAEIDARLDALESFSFSATPSFDPDFKFSGDKATFNEEIESFSWQICMLWLPPASAARFATLEQVERMKRVLVKILCEHVPRIARHYPASEQACDFIEDSLSMLIDKIEKLSRTRAQQSASGRGEFGRETLAQLREKNARLETENEELRKIKEAEAVHEAA